MTGTLVYIKTPQGIEEMARRTQGLSARERQVLIMLNGSVTVDQVLGADKAQEAAAIAEKLRALGLIALLADAPKSAAAPLAATPAAAQPPANEAARMAMAANFMRNTVSTFLGTAASSLITQIDACSSIENLRGHYADWQKAMTLTGPGRKELPDLEKRLAALLS